MADHRFLSNLQNYPKDIINSEVIDLMIPYFNYHSYKYDVAKSVCGNVAGLTQWKISMA